MDVKDKGLTAEVAQTTTLQNTAAGRSRPPSPRAAKTSMDTDVPDQPLEIPLATDGQERAGSDAPSLGDPQSASTERTLNVSDALSYLDSVKAQFAEQPEVYNQFLDIMKDFKSQLIDTPGVIERVSNLFHGHPALIQGFNTFLPAGYRIETSDNPDPNYITVTTPAGTTTQATNAAFKYSIANTLPPPAPEIPADMVSAQEPEWPRVSQESLKPAVTFVHKVRTRYANRPGVYDQFLKILSDASKAATGNLEADQPESSSVAYLSAKLSQGDIVRGVMDLFKDAPDLMRDFVQFLPDEQLQKEELARIVKLEEARKAAEAKSKRSGEASAAVPQKRKRKPVEREKEKDKEPTPRSSSNKKPKLQASSEAPSPALAQRQAAAAPPSPLRAPPQPPPQFYQHHQQTVTLPPPIPVPIQPSSSMHSNDETHFFERVKRFLDNRDTYNEFLKLVNLFTQDIINTTRLVREARMYLGDSELMAQFKDILGWDASKERALALEETWTRPMGVLDRPSRNQLHTRYGSYRKLPAHERNVQCSGRDEMCNSVLNDEWISQPSFASEDAGFIAHKKNQYEEALHRSEEERHEYDFHIEAISRTIQVLEPLNNKIAQLSPEERANFKLKPNLGGVGKAIHQRVIKKIYGREMGLEVWGAMQEIPATAIPVVLMRLKQKHDEWKRAQREWDKVWREVDARNYHKSLDHQAVTFKATDKKAITQKAFVSQIEAARDEQRVTRASFIDPLFARTKPRHQLEFVVEDPTVLQDTLKLTLSFLDRTQGQISLPDRRKIETFLRSFVPLFFMLDPNVFNAAFVPHHETVDSDMDVEVASDDAEMANGNSSRSRNKKGSGSNAGDLRKRLLKSEQAKSSRRTRAQEAASPTPSRFASPVPSDIMQMDGENGIIAKMEKASSRRRGTFYTNTAFYVLLRLLEMLYSRLHLFKNLTKEMADRGNDPFEPNPVSIKAAIEANLAKLGNRLDHASHFYDLMLESCEKLFDNELEQPVFEEMMRYMFGVKHAYKMFTVDKVIGALIKQVQVILSDAKSQDLYELLRREREIPSPTTQDLINCRRNTERVLGPDENLFRIDWLPEPKTMTIQLIGKDDANFDDSEAMTGRWQAYIESFVSHHYTAGVPSSSTVRRPFLLRTKVPSPSGVMPDILARGGLQIKVCVRTYRLFFVPHSEDIMLRLSTSEERASARAAVESRNKKRLAWLEEYAGKTVEEEPKSASTEVPSKPLVVTVPALAPASAEVGAEAETYEAAPEVTSKDQKAEIPMDIIQEQKAKEPEGTVHTAPQDDAMEVAAAAAAVATGPAPDPDADVSMGEVNPEAQAPKVVPEPVVNPLVHDRPQPEPQPSQDVKSLEVSSAPQPPSSPPPPPAPAPAPSQPAIANHAPPATSSGAASAPTPLAVKQDPTPSAVSAEPPQTSATGPAPSPVPIPESNGTATLKPTSPPQTNHPPNMEPVPSAPTADPPSVSILASGLTSKSVPAPAPPVGVPGALAPVLAPAADLAQPSHPPASTDSGGPPL